MSYQKVKNVGLDKDTVFFQSKCSNDTEGYKPDQLPLPEFLLHTLTGNIHVQGTNKFQKAIDYLYEKCAQSDSCFLRFPYIALTWDDGMNDEKITEQERIHFDIACNLIKNKTL